MRTRGKQLPGATELILSPVIVTYGGVEIEECSAHESLGRDAYQAPIE